MVIYTLLSVNEPFLGMQQAQAPCLMHPCVSSWPPHRPGRNGASMALTGRARCPEWGPRTKCKWRRCLCGQPGTANWPRGLIQSGARPPATLRGYEIMPGYSTGAADRRSRCPHADKLPITAHPAAPRRLARGFGWRRSCLGDKELRGALHQRAARHSNGTALLALPRLSRQERDQPG